MNWVWGQENCTSEVSCFACAGGRRIFVCVGWLCGVVFDSSDSCGLKGLWGSCCVLGLRLMFLCWVVVLLYLAFDV